MDFIAHQDSIEKLILAVDAIEAHRDVQLRNLRRALMSRLQTELSYLDGIVGEQWLRRKLELGFTSPLECDGGIVFRTGM